MYQNGDHSPERVKILLFYFRKQAGRNFLKQVVPSALYPKEWIWTTEEVNSIKEQLVCLHQSPRRTATPFHSQRA